MHYVQIKGTELSVSAICLGTALFGRSINEKDSFRLMDEFVALGGSVLDTANVYADWLPGEKGSSERTIGKWLKLHGNRQDIVVGTKGGHPDLTNGGIPRLDADSIRLDLDESLNRLQVHCIDFYWLHRDDPGTSVSSFIELLNEIKREGTIRYFGCSNWTNSRIAEANSYASKHGLDGFTANEIWFSLAVPEVQTSGTDPTLVYMDDQQFSFHRKTCMPVFAYSSQAGGFFSGKYGGESKNLGHSSSAGVMNLYYRRDNLERLDRASEIAKRKRVSTNQIALAYLMHQEFPVIPIVGCKTVAQIQDSCSAANVHLTQNEVSYLMNTLSDPL